jgi:hypothetical protein
MNKSGFKSRNDLQPGESPLDCGDITQELFEGEPHILQLIFARAPLSKILNEICYTLNCQIGNIVSVVTLSDRDRFSAAETAQNAAIFGLFGFFSTDVSDHSGKLFATLDLYSSVSRTPTPGELQWIARAVTLAAIAFTRRVETPGEHNIQSCSDGPKPEFKSLQPARVN